MCDDDFNIEKDKEMYKAMGKVSGSTARVEPVMRHLVCHRDCLALRSTMSIPARMHKWHDGLAMVP
jgi:hypothetical protein